MKFSISNLLIAVALATKITFSKSIDLNLFKRNQLNEPDEIIETDYFKINYYCLEDYNNSCENFKNETLHSLEILSKTFEFYQKVVIDVFVDDTNKYGRCKVGGFAEDFNYVALRTSDDINTPPIIYNQALAKQLRIINNENLKYIDNDFIVILNNGKCFNGYNPYFSKSGYTRTIVHEIIHGLGFNTLLNLQKLNPENNDIEIKFNVTDITNIRLMPKYNVDFSSKFENLKTMNDYNEALSETQIIGFYPLTIYESKIVDIKTGKKIFEDFGNFYQEFGQCIQNQPVPALDFSNKSYMDCYELLSAETKAKTEMIMKDYLMKDKSIGILTKENKIVPIQTLIDGSYMIGSSINHVDYTHFDTFLSDIRNSAELNEKYLNGTLQDKSNISRYLDEDYLMYFLIDDNVSEDLFLDTVGKNNTHGLIGPGIVSIMKSLGWTEKNETRSDDVYYYAEDITLPGNMMVRYTVMELIELNKAILTGNENESYPTTSVPLNEVETETSNPMNEIEYETPNIDEEIDVGDENLPNEEDSGSDSEPNIEN